MTYEDAREAYERASRDVITLRERKHASDELIGKIKAIEQTSEFVAQGTNEKTRGALLLEALENNEQYQAETVTSDELGMAIAFAEVDLSLARYDLQYLIASTGAK